MLKEQLGTVRRQSEQRRRQVLSNRVVEQILPQRLVTAQARAEAPEARLRHETMCRAAASYRRLVEADIHPAPASAREIAINGVRWWVAAPRPNAEAFNERIVAKENFPYRHITQTRDLAIGGIMLDLGANIGRTAIPRVIAGDVTAVYCAEPDPLNFLCLYRNAVDNGLQGLVLPDQVAITRASGAVRLFRAKGSGGHRVLPDGESGSGGPHEAHVIDVEGVTLDAWVARLGVDLRLVTFVKVDTQGAEEHVLAGGERLLAQRHIAWQLEIAPDQLESAGSSLRDLVSRLEGAFTHYIDLNRCAPGERSQPISALGDSLGYLVPPAHTDVIVYNAG